MEKMIQRTAEYHIYYNTYGQSQTILVCCLLVYLFGSVPDIPPLEFYSFGFYRYLLQSLDWDKVHGLHGWAGKKETEL